MVSSLPNGLRWVTAFASVLVLAAAPAPPVLITAAPAPPVLTTAAPAPPVPITADPAPPVPTAAPPAVAVRTTALSANPVQITGAWARATAPGQDSGAVYLNITSTSPDQLLSAASPDAQSAMLHQTTHTGSMSGMEDMESLTIAAGATVAFTPGAAHIMLMGLRHGLKAGTQIKLDLTFAHAGTMHVSVPVEPITASGPPG